MHDARNSYTQHVPIGNRLLGRYLDKAYNSFPGGVGLTPHMASLKVPIVPAFPHASLLTLRFDPFFPRFEIKSNPKTISVNHPPHVVAPIKLVTDFMGRVRAISTPALLR